MSLTLFTNEPCPKCRKPIRQTTIDVHPTSRNLALHIYKREDCGPVKTKVISMTKKGPPPERAVESNRVKKSRRLLSLQPVTRHPSD